MFDVAVRSEACLVGPANKITHRFFKDEAGVEYSTHCQAESWVIHNIQVRVRVLSEQRVELLPDESRGLDSTPARVNKFAICTASSATSKSNGSQLPRPSISAAFLYSTRSVQGRYRKDRTLAPILPPRGNSGHLGCVSRLPPPGYHQQRSTLKPDPKSQRSFFFFRLGSRRSSSSMSFYS